MERTYIIAEAGVNHNGSLLLAKQLVDVAVAVGADAVKFQTFTAENIVSLLAPKAKYQAETTDIYESQYEMLKKLELSLAMHQELIVYCRLQNIEFLSTPFDLPSVDVLINYCKVKKMKISSGEITNAPLLLKVAQMEVPVLLSTGMSTLGEIEIALGVLAFGYLAKKERPSVDAFLDTYYSRIGQEVLKDKVTLLHCTTEYPAPFDEVNLCNIDTLHSAFGLPVGFSDHTKGIAVSLAAVAKGAVVIEKHFTVDKSLPGPDHQASLDPEELRQLVMGIRQIEQSLGSGRKTPTSSEQKNRRIVRKSLVAAQKICLGEAFTTENLTVKRPGDGISPYYYWDYLNKNAAMAFEKDEQVK